MLAAGPAFAQVADSELASAEKASDDSLIVVTGSRIARRSVEATSPIEVIDSKRLDSRGYQTVAQALNELPTFGIPGSSPIGFDQSSFGAGQSFVNFLGLGSQRTLTLVNGRRFVSGNSASIFGPTGSGGGQVDLNTIPTKLIDRVETVAAIGAPIYGSDAIAGTINIILKKDFEGLDLDVQNGISSHGDAPDYRFRALAGKNFADGRGNITLAGEYNQSKGLLYNARAITRKDARFGDSRTGSGPQPIYGDYRIPGVDPSGVILVGGGVFGLDLPLSPQQAALFLGDPTATFSATNAAGQQVRFGRDGSLVPIDFGNVIGPDDGFSVFTDGGNGFSLNDVSNLVTDLKRFSVNANLSFEVSSKLRLFGEAWYSVSQGRNLANQPVYNTALFGSPGSTAGSLVMSLSNPFLSDAARTAIANSIASNPFSDQNFGLTEGEQDYFYLGRANTDLSTGVSVGRSQVLRFVGGFEGEVTVLPEREWHFEAFFNYGQAKVRSRNPELNQQNFLNAINAVDDGSGNIICAPGYENSPIATLSSTCAPLNLFGQQTSQAARDYVTTIATPRSVNNQYDVVASIAGPLFRLPGGDLAFSLGYEHRAESSRFDPGAFYYGTGTGDSSSRGSYGRSVPIDAVYGKYNTDEIFGELRADLIGPENDIPLVHALTIQTAGRYIWNSIAGNDPTYTFQARYEPVKDVAFRAAYTRAVRAPSITEAFNPTSSSFDFAVDVCDRTLIGEGPDPATRAANCAAAGVPANFVSNGDASINSFTFGNANLQNEKSDSYTVGVVLTPEFIPGFNATVDYINIKVNNAISLYSTDDVVAACYDSVNFPDNQFCDLVARDPVVPGETDINDYQLDTVGTTYFNSARLTYKGIVAAVSYQRPTDFLGVGSSVRLAVSYQYLINRTNQTTADSVAVQVHDSVGYSQHKGVATISYSNKGFNAAVDVNYIGPARIDPDKSDTFYSVPKVKAFTFVNLAVSQQINDRFSIRGVVDNVFNARAPYPYPASGGTNTYFQGIMGRYFRVGASVNF